MNRPRIDYLMATLGAALMLQFGVPANAQYREGQPPTLLAPPRAPDRSAAIGGSFASAYARVGHPRLVVFWNREFSDEVSSSYRDHLHLTETKRGKSSALSETTAGPTGVSTLTTVESGRIRSLDATEGSERVTSARPRLLDEAVDWKVEQAFGAALSRAGVRLIDRAAMIRLQGVSQNAGERANVQDIEARGLIGKADLVIEVLQTADPQAQDGISFRVTVRDVRAEELLASFSTNGRPPPVRTGYVAGADGFVRAAPPPVVPADIGNELANQTMLALARSWR
jgi:hypothetical protein